MTTVTDRIARWLAFCGISRDQLADAIGMPSGALRDYLAVGMVPARHIDALAVILDVEPSWLVRGKGASPCWWTVRP